MEKQFYLDIGIKIQKLRKERKMSQKDLAEKIGKKSATYVNLIEFGKRKTSLHSLTRIAKALKVPINSFLDKNYNELNPDELLELALISDTKLNPHQQRMIMEFVHCLRHKHDHPGNNSKAHT